MFGWGLFLAALLYIDWKLHPEEHENFVLSHIWKEVVIGTLGLVVIGVIASRRKQQPPPSANSNPLNISKK